MLSAGSGGRREVEEHWALLPYFAGAKLRLGLFIYKAGFIWFPNPSP
jgi:hypothetical protein